MKNYLFEPFKKKIEKINAFNELKSTIISCIDEKNVDTNYAITPLIIFVGKLESYYDVEICRLREEHEHSEGIAWGNGKVQELKAENDRLNNNAYDNNKELIKVKRCNKTMDGILLEREEEIKKLKADIKHFKDIANEDFKMIDDDRDKLQAENQELKLLSCTDDCQDNVNSLIKLQEEIKELKAELVAEKKQYHMMASSKEYQAEAEEYFHHNPKCKSLLFFMIGSNEFTFDEENDMMNGISGEYEGTLYADDCLIQIDNEEVIA